jgi:hypothetical protein
METKTGARALVGCFHQSDKAAAGQTRRNDYLSHLILRSIVQSALADCAMRLEDEVASS